MLGRVTFKDVSGSCSGSNHIHFSASAILQLAIESMDRALLKFKLGLAQ